MLLIRGAAVYAPEPLGVRDILISEGHIVEVAQQIDIGYHRLETVDGRGLLLLPGLIDQHVHILGGGGESGFQSMIEPLPFRQFAAAGVTTVVGLLGTDSMTKDVHSLLARVKALRAMGLTAYCLTGSYALPSPTVTGSVSRDIALIGEILGVKLALSDHRCSYPTRDELLRLASEVRIGSLLSGKRGFVHIHLGREASGLSEIIDIVNSTDLPVDHFRPTHCANQPEDALRFAALGGRLDYSTGDDLPATVKAVRRAMEQVNPGQITVSSDAGGSLPLWDEHRNLIGMGKGAVDTMPQTLRLLVEDGLPLEEALPLFTRNVAEGLGLPHKGVIREGADADLLLVRPDWSMQAVYAMGQKVAEDGRCLVEPFYKNEEGGIGYATGTGHHS